MVLLWLVLLVTSSFVAKSVGSEFSNNFSFPHTQSFDAINLLKSVAPAQSGDSEQVVFGTSGGTTLADPAIGQRINAMVDQIKALPSVSVVASPYDAAGNLVDTTKINHDQTVGWLQVNFDKQPNVISNAEAKKYVNIVTSTSGQTLGRAQVKRELVNKYESAAEPAGPRTLPRDQDRTGRHRQDCQPDVVLGLLPEDGGVLG